MRILMLVWGYWPAPEGGAERQCRRLAEKLVGDRYECTVWTAWHAWGMPRKDAVNGVCVRRFGVLVPVSVVAGQVWDSCVRNAWKWLCPNRRLSQERLRVFRFWCLLPIVWLARLSFVLEVIYSTVCARSRLDVVHVHEPCWTAGLGVWLGDRWDIPVVATEATYPALPVIGYDVPLRGLWARLRLNCFYIAKHEDSRASLVEHGIPADRIRILPNGVPTPEVRAKVDVNQNVLLVANLEQGSHQKAFDVLIGAWPDVVKRCPGARLVIVGSGDAAPWKDLASSLGCNGSIQFEGYCDNPGKYYQQAALFAMPSRVEGLSNALLEAQSWGVPAIVSDIAGNRAVIREGENGLIVPVGNAAALSDAIVNLLIDADARKHMGLAARNRIEQMFSVDVVSRKLESIYEGLNALFASRAERK
jgi:glycosyltransferase involved in cell wall biosynthesis